jgi:hypothetical protein
MHHPLDTVMSKRTRTLVREVTREGNNVTVQVTVTSHKLQMQATASARFEDRRFVKGEVTTTPWDEVRRAKLAEAGITLVSPASPPKRPADPDRQERVEEQRSLRLVDLQMIAIRACFVGLPPGISKKVCGLPDTNYFSGMGKAYQLLEKPWRFAALRYLDRWEDLLLGKPELLDQKPKAIAKELLAITPFSGIMEDKGGLTYLIRHSWRYRLSSTLRDNWLQWATVSAHDVARTKPGTQFVMGNYWLKMLGATEYQGVFFRNPQAAVAAVVRYHRREHNLTYHQAISVPNILRTFQEIRDYTVYSGEDIPTTIGMELLLERSHAYHQEEARMEVLRRVGYPLDTPIPSPPGILDMYDLDEYQIHRLLTVNEILEEGRVMKHCVGGYSSHAVQGLTFIFSLRKDGERISTISLRKMGTGYEVEQNYGVHNSFVSLPIQNMVRTWASGLRRPLTN